MIEPMGFGGPNKGCFINGGEESWPPKRLIFKWRGKRKK
jgi:hypothetical protein